MLFSFCTHSSYHCFSFPFQLLNKSFSAPYKVIEYVTLFSKLEQNTAKLYFERKFLIHFAQSSNIFVYLLDGDLNV